MEAKSREEAFPSNEDERAVADLHALPVTQNSFRLPICAMYHVQINQFSWS